jgi:hypothetical protein
MPEPFERLLGDTSELRILHYLLPLNGSEFNMTEIAIGAGISRQTAIRMVNKFMKWGILKITCKRGNAYYYALREDAVFIEVLESLNYCIINQMLGKKTMTGIASYSTEHAPLRAKPTIRGRLKI